MNWEDKFDKDFKHCFNIGVVPDDITYSRIKISISNLLKQQRAELHKENIESIQRDAIEAGIKEHHKQKEK